MLRNFLPVCLAAWSLVAFGVALTGCETKKPAPRTASNAPAPPTPSAEGAPTGTQGGTQAADAPTACQPGFEAKGGQCVDIDECSFVGSVCGTAQATCANKPGGYECTCPRGYAGGGPLGIACAPRIATGNAGTCVLPEGARMKCWGAPAGGVFAAEDNKIGSHEPEYLIDSEAPVALALSARHGCLLRPDSTVACWGNNQHGQVGDGTTEMRFSPTAVKGLTGAIAISVGYDFSCAVLKTGALMCWGNPERGGFGEKSVKKVLEPVASPITDVASIAIKSSSSCALQRNGKVVCWGANHNAQLGLGTLSPRNELVAPTPVPKLDGITEIRLGGEMGVALQKGGRVRPAGSAGAARPLRRQQEVLPAQRRAALSSERRANNDRHRPSGWRRLFPARWKQLLAQRRPPVSECGRAPPRAIRRHNQGCRIELEISRASIRLKRDVPTACSDEPCGASVSAVGAVFPRKLRKPVPAQRDQLCGALHDVLRGR